MIEADLDEVKIKEEPESPAASGDENNPPKRHRGPKATKFGRANKETPLVCARVGMPHIGLCLVQPHHHQACGWRGNSRVVEWEVGSYTGAPVP